MFDIPGTPTVIPEDISRHEFFKRFWKGCREDVVVVVGYELSKVNIDSNYCGVNLIY